MLIIRLCLILSGGQIIFATYFEEIAKCKLTSHGSEYIGTVNKTLSGKLCTKWTADLVKNFKLNERNLLDLNIVSPHNYCRNYNLDPKGPWCATGEETLKWEYCNIPSCKKENNWCKDSIMGREYLGIINVTISGEKCLLWTPRNWYKETNLPEKSHELAKNYCRSLGNHKEEPVCIIAKQPFWEKCHVTLCEKELTQSEYFGGSDFLKHMAGELNIIRFPNVYKHASIKISIEIKKWTLNNKSKMALWGTEYDPLCQRDLDEYEYCEISRSIRTESHMHLFYSCNRPLKNLIFISPLLKTDYKIDYNLEEMYEVKMQLNKDFMKYQKKMDKYLNANKNIPSFLPYCPNFGSFLLISKNSFPYAITRNNKIVFAISEIEKGRVGFIACDNIIENYESFKGFLQTIYEVNEIHPVVLNQSLIKSLSEESLNDTIIKRQFIWNAHRIVGDFSAKLLELIKNGLRIVIGIKPSAYDTFDGNLVNSELQTLFKSAGIWPTMDSLNETIIKTKKDIISVYPLIQQFDYAKTNLTNLKDVSESISNIIVKVPFQRIGNENDFIDLNENIEELINIYSNQIKSLIPCMGRPALEKSERNLIYFYNTLLIYPFNPPIVAPGVSFYPGNFLSDNYKPLKVQLTLNLKFKNDPVQLGLYLPPGKLGNAKILTSNSQTCILYLNFHLSDVHENNRYDKWPVTMKKIWLQIVEVQSFSFPFGGLLSMSCDSNNDKVDIILYGVIQVPVFDRRDSENNKKWITLQKSKVPWAVLAGDSFVFVVSINAVRNLGDPDKVLQLYDSMVKEGYHLRGKSIKAYRRALISTDIQITGKHKNTRYPIGTSIKYVTNPKSQSQYLFDFNNIKLNGNWFVLYEIGLNLRSSPLYIISEKDAISNLFALVGTEYMTNKSSWSKNEGWASNATYINQTVLYINNGKFSDLQSNPSLALGIYAQLRANFQWELFYQVYREYNKIEKSVEKMFDKEKIQHWIKMTSHKAKMNLCPLYDLWRWPIDKETNHELSKYPFFLPDDFLMKLVPERVVKIQSKYGGSLKVKRKGKKLEEIVGPLKNKLKIEGERIIEKITINK